MEEGRRLQGGDPEADVWSKMKIDLPFKCDSEFACAPFANEAAKVNGCFVLNLELRRNVRVFKPKGVLNFRNLDEEEVSSRKSFYFNFYNLFNLLFVDSISNQRMAWRMTQTTNEHLGNGDHRREGGGLRGL